MGTIKCKVEAGCPGFTAERASHSLRFGSEIKVCRMQFPILLCGRNGQEFEKSNILEAIIPWQYLWEDLQKALHPVIKMLGHLVILL